MPTRIHAHLPIAHNAAGATIATPAMIPATLMFAKHRAAHPVMLLANAARPPGDPPRSPAPSKLSRSLWLDFQNASLTAAPTRIAYRPRVQTCPTSLGFRISYARAHLSAFCEPVTKPGDHVMPVIADAHLPIAHSAAGATIATMAMVPATSMFAKHRAAHPVMLLANAAR